MIIAVPKETFPSETRVAATPETVRHFIRMNLEICVETGAGTASGFTDNDYREAGAAVSDTRSIYQKAGILLKIRAPQTTEIPLLQRGQIILADFSGASSLRPFAEKKTTCFALEQIPRISRAQTMDILTSQSNLAGYKAVINAAAMLKKTMPLMMTAAGTLPPAKVLILGAGVAGLQAIATAKRLGAQVFASDIRPETQEQINSLGARFVTAQDIPAQISKTDILITTALAPGKPAPKLVSREMLAQMPRGGIIIDMASASGGNVEGIEDNRTINRNGVTLIGAGNLAAELPDSASRMFAQNVYNFLNPWFSSETRGFNFDFADEIIAQTCVVHNGKIINREKN